MKDDSEHSKPGFLQITWSLIAAFCGIQNDANLDRDDSHIEKHGFMPYIIIGVGLTILFVLMVVLTVQIILRVTA